MTKLLILRGIPGSGKSTYASTTGNERVCRDDLRELHLGSALNFSDEGLITAVQDTLIDYHLRAGTDVVVDNTNVEPKYVKALAGIGLRAGADVEIKIIDVSLSTALERNKERAAQGGRDVPEDVIKGYYDRLQKTLHLDLLKETF